MTTPLAGEHARDRVTVQMELARDGTHAPVFGLVQAQDVGAKFDGNRHGSGPLPGRKKPGRSWGGTLAPQKRQRHGAGVTTARTAMGISNGAGNEVARQVDEEVHNGSVV